MTETEWESDLKKKLEGAGALVLGIGALLRQSQSRKMGRHTENWPDMLVYHFMWTGHLELKVENKKVTDGQADTIRELRSRGVKALVLRHKAGRIQIETVDNVGVGTTVVDASEYLGAMDLLTRLRRVG